ncbi:hypothetical protein HMPREF0988_00904 [Lachnospiraceae bacterium 1_4_56FAA]|nr:hypothetical protein HMPREF0988_00904 [Lachnospiraceae bacterium 1_4_56FAA]
MKDYTKFMNWAVVTMIDRSTQDDRKSKLRVEALFSSPTQAEDNYNAPNKEIRRYTLHVDDLERFEEFYNHVQDINEQFGDHAIFHINEGFTVDELNKFRQVLGLWTDAKIK